MIDDKDLFDEHGDTDALANADCTSPASDYYEVLERIMKKLNRVNEKVDLLLEDAELC